MAHSHNGTCIIYLELGMGDPFVQEEALFQTSVMSTCKDEILVMVRYVSLLLLENCRL